MVTNIFHSNNHFNYLVFKMSDNEDPYAVSDDEDEPKGPPPKITFDRSTDLTQIVRIIVSYISLFNLYNL